VIFIDLALARRLEATEGLAGARTVEARRLLAPESGAVWMEIAGAVVLFDGAASPVTQTFGLGLAVMPDAAEFDRIEAFFRERGAPACHELSPLAGLALSETLVRRGYRPVEFTNVLFQPLPAALPPAPAASRVTARRMAQGEAALWSDISARAWGADHPEYVDYLRDLGRIMAAAEDASCFFAECDGQTIGTAKLGCHGDTAILGGASTLLEARRQGAQRALLEARLAAATAAGCDLVMMCAHPGSASQRNAERQGFRVAYTRTKWQRDFSA
jgi:hypothetical protein